MLKNFPGFFKFLGWGVITALAVYSLPTEAYENLSENNYVLSQTNADLLQNNLLEQLQIVNKNLSIDTPVNYPPPNLNFYPVTTPQMTPGVNTNLQTSYPGLIQSIFLIGSDGNSRQWLKDHQAQLQKLKALGLVVSVPNAEELQALQESAKGLTLIPANGSAIAKQFSISHYPALLIGTRNLQQS